MKKLKELILNNKGEIFLLAVATLAIFLYVNGTKLSAEYNARLQNKASVISTVTDIQEKTRTKEMSIEGCDGVEFHTYDVTCYEIETTYEYNNQKYNYSFESDNLYINDESGDYYSIGKKLPLLIDSTSPGYVLDGNPGYVYQCVSYVLAGILLIVLIYYLIYKFFSQHLMFALFVVPFLIGAVLTFGWGIYSIAVDKADFIGYLLAFIIAPIYAGISFLFFKISKSN